MLVTPRYYVNAIFLCVLLGLSWLLLHQICRVHLTLQVLGTLGTLSSPLNWICIPTRNMIYEAVKNGNKSFEAFITQQKTNNKHYDKVVFKCCRWDSNPHNQSIVACKKLYHGY